MNCLPGEYTGPAPQEHRCDYHQDKDWKVGRSLKKKERKKESVPSAEMCVRESFFSQPHPKTNISSTPKDLKEFRGLRPCSSQTLNLGKSPIFLSQDLYVY